MLTILKQPYERFQATLNIRGEEDRERDNQQFLKSSAVIRVGALNAEQSSHKLDNMPLELIGHTLSYLEHCEVLSCRRVHSRWQRAVALEAMEIYPSLSIASPFSYQDYFHFQQHAILERGSLSFRTLVGRAQQSLPLVAASGVLLAIIFAKPLTFKANLKYLLVSVYKGGQDTYEIMYDTLLNSSMPYLVNVIFIAYVLADPLPKIYQDMRAGLISSINDFYKFLQQEFQKGPYSLAFLLKTYFYIWYIYFASAFFTSIGVEMLGKKWPQLVIIVLFSLILPYALSDLELFKNVVVEKANILEALGVAAYQRGQDVVHERSVTPHLGSHYYLLRGHPPLSAASKQLNEALHGMIKHTHYYLLKAAEEGMLKGILVEHPYAFPDEDKPQILLERLLASRDFSLEQKIGIILRVLSTEQESTPRIALLTKIAGYIADKNFLYKLLERCSWLAVEDCKSVLTLARRPTGNRALPSLRTLRNWREQQAQLRAREERDERQRLLAEADDSYFSNNLEELNNLDSLV